MSVGGAQPSIVVCKSIGKWLQMSGGGRNPVQQDGVSCGGVWWGLAGGRTCVLPVSDALPLQVISDCSLRFTRAYHWIRSL
eukprot:364631-Chlamydomonas_euryale.AAC.21